MSDLDVTLPNVRSDAFQRPHLEALTFVGPSMLGAAPLVQPTHETASLLEVRGAETRIFDLSGLPLPDDAPGTHRKVAKLRKLVAWSEGQGHGGWALDLIRSLR